MKVLLMDTGQNHVNPTSPSVSPDLMDLMDLMDLQCWYAMLHHCHQP